MSSLSLLEEQWLPVIHRDGHYSKIKPSQLHDDTIIDLALSRPDFQGAAYQFLIGLLQTTFPLADNEEWFDIWEQGFSQSQLDDAFAKVAVAMQIGQGQPSFLQEAIVGQGSEKIEATPIAELLAEAPGKNTLMCNKDHFIKRDFVKAICPHCAIITLFTLQNQTSSGGRGYAVSLRGGGPLTTLLMPISEQNAPLWKKLWLNVIPLEENEVPKAFDGSVFPWLNSRDTKLDKIVTPKQANYCQAYWGMPRRIEIDWQQQSAGNCDLCGEASTRLVTHYYRKIDGISYKGWVHPLTPYRKNEELGLIAIKGRFGGFSYKDWLGIVIDNGINEIARVVDTHYDRRLNSAEQFGLWCFGYHFDNAKVFCWYEHTYPVIPALAKADNPLRALVESGLLFAENASRCLNEAIRKISSNAIEKKVTDNILPIAFWKETETDFYQFIQRLLKESDPSKQISLLTYFAETLRDYVFRTFDRIAFSNVDEHIKLSQSDSDKKKGVVKTKARINLSKALTKLFKQLSTNA